MILAPSDNMKPSDFIAIGSAIIAVFALFVSVYAAKISHKVATSDFQTSEKVKADTAGLIAVLRSLMIKGIIYSQQDKETRDDAKLDGFVDIAPELAALREFTQGPTALAYYSFVLEKSKRAKKANVEGEYWRVFFLELGQLQQIKNPWTAALRAGKIERELGHLSADDFREIAGFLGNIPKAIKLLFQEREHDVLFDVMANMDATVAREAKERQRGIPEELFKDFVRFLREKKAINDPDLDLFWAAMSNDVKLLEGATERGAEINITSAVVIDRYKQYVTEFRNSLTGGN